MRLKRTLSIVSLLLVLVLFVSFCQSYLFRTTKRDELRMEGFRLEEKNSLDVVLIGSSEVYYGYAAPYAYAQEGITSYPYAVASCPVSLWKPMLEDILSRQTPQLIIVETNGALYPATEQLHNNAPMHYVLDGMPLNETKLEALEDLVTENTDSKASFILPFIKYHSNWQQLKELAFVYENYTALNRRGHSLLRGMATKPIVHAPTSDMRKVKNNHTEYELFDEAEQYLREFLEYCQEKKLNVLFTSFPHQIMKAQTRLFRNFKKTNTVERIVGEYGFPYLNFDRIYQDIGIDPNTDFQEKSHLNIYGQKKLTAYLARYIIENCGVQPVDHGEKQRAEWTESAEYYELFFAYAEERMSGSNTNQIAETAALIAKLDKMKQTAG